MQYCHNAEMIVPVVQDEEWPPRLDKFIEGLERRLKWWKEHGTQEHLTGRYPHVEWGCKLTREDENDIWCH